MCIRDRAKYSWRDILHPVFARPRAGEASAISMRANAIPADDSLRDPKQKMMQEQTSILAFLEMMEQWMQLHVCTTVKCEGRDQCNVCQWPYLSVSLLTNSG